VKLLSIELEGYRQYSEPTRIEFEAGFTGICGPNGVGKSKLVEAIGFALYGVKHGILPRGDYKRDLPSHGRPGARPRVELRLEARGQVLRIERTSNTASIEVDGLGILADTPTGVTAKVIELLRMSPQAYLGTFTARQRDVAGLLELDADKRHRLVNRLIGVSQIEVAISIADDWRRSAAEAARTAQALVTQDPTEAEAIHIDLVGQRAAAEEQAGVLRSELVQAEARSRVAGDEARAAAEAATTADGLRNQIAELEEHLGSRNDEIDQAKQRLESAELSRREVEEVEADLASTAGADAEREKLEAAQSLADLRQRIEAESGEVDRLLAASKERDALRADLAAAEEISETANGLRADANEALALARQECERERETLAAIKDQMANAKDLGEAGRCVHCGHQFGSELPAVLRHFAEEIAASKGRLEGLAAAVREGETLLADRVTASQAANATEQAARTAAEAFDLVPGQLTAARAVLASLEDELPQAGSDFGKPDPARLSEVINIQTERSGALLKLERLRGEAADAEAAQALLESSQRARDTLLSRRTELEASLVRSDEAAAEGSALIEARARALAAEASARAEELEHERAMASLIEREGRAAADLEEARHRSANASAASRQVLVRERVVELLRLVLNEVTEEARPRLEELMDGWGRSLLGTRFQGVRLTEDYRVQADNGSGWHEISHFSGGEQTVLAVMLRVAISMFCRERAGFDAGFLILDEIFGDQDSEHRALLLEFLGEIQRQYHQVLVINHVEDVTAMLDSIIDVTPTGANTSTAAYRL
jgi:exonuclease SbcC